MIQLKKIMKKILILLFLLISTKTWSQSSWEIYQDKIFSKPSVGISWSLNTLNPYGLALTYSGGKNNLFAMINYNNGL